ncbi:2-C-methyl-D-erythritol 2,4-cyclodiphosphate synthase [Desertihabitans brevis]|uniref:2-C-methyl-D-erythritol 2,4-cyclodiphosphate synthase n=1 Tax=Desertihabitans brevis TaxID=2268447 RepID=A0A367YXW0_9ACTN|nr:2-C-methyl-D-erythritol 2,4-cyclodiphosphate synthase [Desertihabitans brevis]
MGAGSPAKALRLLAGRPLVWHSVAALVEGGADEVVVAIRPELVEQFSAALADLAERVPLRFVPGGRERQESVDAALDALTTGPRTSRPPAVVLVHDAARPLVPPEVVRRVADRVLAGDPVVVPVVPVVDTVRRLDESGSTGVDRSRLRAVQTPQGFRPDVLREGHDRLRADGTTVTDDAGACELAGHRAVLVEGSPRSLKVTTEHDLQLAEGLLGAAAATLRTGTGIDVHRLAPGRPMRVACLDFPDEEMGPVGHSDGDVVAHAACDALLAAAGLGDLGSNYGTSDPAWAGASGRAFLVETARRLAAAGFHPVNVSVQLVGQRPRFAARRAEAEAVMGAALGAPVSLSATTTDGLGLTGRGEGLAAIATALVRG